MTRNILIIQRRMTEYRVPLFEALRQRLAKNGVALQVIYGTPSAAEALRGDAGSLSWGVEIPCRYLLPEAFHITWQNIPPQLIEKQDMVIIPHENMQMMNYLLLFKRHLLKKMILAFWGHGANFQPRAHNYISEKIRGWTARQADWFFAYTPLSVNKVISTGFPAQRITCLNNSIDTTSFKIWQADITAGEQQVLLRALGFQGKKLGIFLGGLYQDKRLDFLFAAANELRRRIPDFELLIIGDGPQRDLVRKYVSSRPWCHWSGARHGRDKVLYGSLGQIMLNPGLVGLNILDSFCLGIPLITTDCHIHSPEIAYLESGRNGVMTINKLTPYVDAAEQLLTEPVLRKELSRNCSIDANRYSLDNMVKNFCSGITQALAPPSSPDTLHVVVIWQRFLPYHKARIRHLNTRLTQLGCRLTAIEVASQDSSYGFAETSDNGDF